MKNDLNKVLINCIVKAREGEINMDVFDLMYETSLSYPKLKDILDKLVLKNELAVIDIKTYKFIGNLNRDIEALKPKHEVDKAQSSDNVQQETSTDERRAYLEARRRELIRRMQEQMKDEEEQEYEDDFEDDEEENDVVIEDITDNNDNFDYLKAAEGVDPKNLQKAKEFLKSIIINSKNSSDENSEEFVQLFSERAILLIASDLRMSRVAAINKTKLALEDVQKTGNKKIIAIYERIVSELQNMSNYYYIKIRTLLLRGI